MDSSLQQRSLFSNIRPDAKSQSPLDLRSLYLGQSNDPFQTIMNLLTQPRRTEVKGLPDSGNPSRSVRNYVQMFDADEKHEHARSPDKIEKYKQYITICTAFDSWIIRAMKSADLSFASLAVRIDKRFGLYSLKFIKTLEDLDRAQFISMLQVPLDGETEQNATDRLMLKEIFYEFSIGHLSDILRIIDTPNCNCEICKL
jgi:hypothetical protein